MDQIRNVKILLSKPLYFGGVSLLSFFASQNLSHRRLIEVNMRELGAFCQPVWYNKVVPAVSWFSRMAFSFKTSFELLAVSFLVR